jgi:predicted ribosome quality control (RQC) complex YloA/Tae2 family protein
MGMDKRENDTLLEFADFKQDIWFHVENYSSAHLYLKIKDISEWENLPEVLLMDLAQLTKVLQRSDSHFRLGLYLMLDLSGEFD